MHTKVSLQEWVHHLRNGSANTVYRAWRQKLSSIGIGNGQRKGRLARNPSQEHDPGCGYCAVGVLSELVAKRNHDPFEPGIGPARSLDCELNQDMRVRLLADTSDFFEGSFDGSAEGGADSQQCHSSAADFVEARYADLLQMQQAGIEIGQPGWIRARATAERVLSSRIRPIPTQP